MEAMSIETLLLSAWEEEGFVGKTRVPLDHSDVDVLAIHANERKVRIGESKVREGSQTVYLVDESSLAWMASQPHQDFTAWMGDDWSRWLRNLPKLWDKEGRPVVPWLLPVSQVGQVQVVFCCNLVILCERRQADQALARASVRFLGENSALAELVDRPDFIQARIVPTVEVVTDLIGSVFGRIESGYGRRFADHFKDVFREIHRYLRPELDRLPCNRDGHKIGTRKSPHEDRIRRATVLSLLQTMGVGKDELSHWLVDDVAKLGGAPASTCATESVT
jgi:hypothetical protein